MDISIFVLAMAVLCFVVIRQHALTNGLRFVLLVFCVGALLGCVAMTTGVFLADNFVAAVYPGMNRYEPMFTRGAFGGTVRTSFLVWCLISTLSAMSLPWLLIPVSKKQLATRRALVIYPVVLALGHRVGLLGTEVLLDFNEYRLDHLGRKDDGLASMIFAVRMRDLVRALHLLNLVAESAAVTMITCGSLHLARSGRLFLSVATTFLASIALLIPIGAYPAALVSIELQAALRPHATIVAVIQQIGILVLSACGITWIVTREDDQRPEPGFTATRNLGSGLV